MPHAFLVMPFKAPFEQVYLEVLKPTLEEHGFLVGRADTIPNSGVIIEDILHQIRNSDLIVVEATEPNPNVYYEIGCADAHQREILLLTQFPDNIPFDIRGKRHLVYAISRMDELKAEFARWVKATRPFRLHSRRIADPILHRGEIFEHIFDSVSYGDFAEGTPQDLLLAEIRDGSMISSRFSYAAEKGTKHWLELCHDSLYTVYHDSISYLSANASKLLAACGKSFLASSPDVISLGPGDGIKDRIILNALARELDKDGNAHEMFYYPVDVSHRMLATAVHTIREDYSLSRRIKIKAFHSDFKHLSAFRPVYNFRPEPNLFLLLGNTFGNMQDEKNFLHRLYRAMYPGDILLLEVRLHTDELRLGGPEDEQLGLAFSPLASLGVPFNRDKIVRSRSRESVSQVPRTQSILTRMRDVQVGDMYAEEVLLGCINFYDHTALRETLEVDFQVLAYDSTRQLGYYLLRKPASEASERQN
jgi:hypothetical protein